MIPDVTVIIQDYLYGGRGHDYGFSQAAGNRPSLSPIEW